MVRSFLPALQDTPMDFESFQKQVSPWDLVHLLICDEDTCVVDLAKVLINFFRSESCGKCTPCRIGTQRAYDLLDGISNGTGSMQDLDTLLHLADSMYALSNCGLGQTAGTPIKDIIKNFREEVETHIRDGVCPAGVCKINELAKV